MKADRRSPLDRIIAHVRAQNRAGTHQAVLLAEIDRLTAENEFLRLDAGAVFCGRCGALAAESAGPDAPEGLVET